MQKSFKLILVMSSFFFLVMNAAQAQNCANVQISGFSPDTVLATETGFPPTITVSGSGFGVDMIVNWDLDAPTTFTYINSTSITLRLARTYSGWHSLTITCGQSTVTAEGVATVRNGEFVTDRTESFESGGDTIEIFGIGSQFDSGTQAYFDSTDEVCQPGMDTSFLPNTSTSFTDVNHLQITTPALTEGFYTMILKNSSGSVICPGLPFVYVRAPEVFDCVNPGTQTLFTRDTTGKVLCWNNARARLIGYSVFEETTWKGHFCGDTNCTGNQVKAQIWHTDWGRSFMSTVRYVPTNVNDNNRSHGVNHQKVTADGQLNQLPIRDTYGEQMPWKKVSGKFDVCENSTLDDIYRKQLNDVLYYAERHGQSIMLSLFNGSQLKMNWNNNNPWNPNANDMQSCPAPACSTSLPTTGDPFPEFYDICNDGYGNTNPCTDANLKCLGKMEKNFVNKVIDIVISGYGTNNGAPYVNVIFEVMNESKTSDIDTDAEWRMYYKWHNTVARWIKDRSSNAYLVAASPASTYADVTACCPNCNSGSCVCTPDDCVNKASQVYLLPNIDIVAQHWGGWQVNGSPDPCQGAKAAHWRFKKPVFIDDDGGPGFRDNNANVKSWAIAATGTGCFGAVGKVHFNHLDENKYMPAAPNSQCTDNQPETTLKVDCSALDQLADARPKNLCSGSGICADCPTKYCCKIFRPAACATSGGACYGGCVLQ